MLNLLQGRLVTQRRRVATLLAGLVTACSSPVDPGSPDPATYTIVPTRAWAGSALVVRSSAFRSSGDDVQLRMGLATLDMQRGDDTTMTVQLPATFGGIYDPVVVMGDSLVLLEQVVVDGFLDRRDYGPRFPWDLYPRRQGSHAGVMGATLDRALATIDLETFEVTTIPGGLDFTQLRGPGPTPDPDVFVLRPVGRGFESWRLGAPPTLVASHPELGVSHRQVMQLGSQSWFVSSNHQFETWRRQSPADPFTITTTIAEETEGVHRSPRGDRATIRVDQMSVTEPGVPVFALPDGDVAYHIPLASVQGVDWSPDGATLAVAGGSQVGARPGSVLLIDATSGQVQRVAQTTLPVFAVAIDPVRPFIYVGVTTASFHPSILVLDRSSLTQVGEMTVPVAQPACGQDSCYGGVIAVGHDALFVFWSFNGPARAYRFLLREAVPFP